MKTTIFILLALMFTSSIQSQTAQPFMLGFVGMYPDGSIYGVTQNIDWSWYGWQLIINNEQ